MKFHRFGSVRMAVATMYACVSAFLAWFFFFRFHFSFTFLYTILLLVCIYLYALVFSLSTLAESVLLVCFYALAHRSIRLSRVKTKHTAYIHYLLTGCALFFYQCVCLFISLSLFFSFITFGSSRLDIYNISFISY